MFIENLLTDPIYFFRIVAILIISVTLHELAHGWAALSQGDDTPSKTGHMTPNPIVHMGWPSLIFLCLAGIVWGQMPVNPSKFRNPKWGNIWVSAAGPLMNLSLGLGAILLINLVSNGGLLGFVSIDFFYYLATINLVLCLFNFLPIPPLDGFHVLSEFFPSLKPLQNSPFGMVAFMVLFYSGASAYLFLIARFVTNNLVIF